MELFSFKFNFLLLILYIAYLKELILIIDYQFEHTYCVYKLINHIYINDILLIINDK